MLTNKEAIKALRDIAKYYSYITPNDKLTALKMAIKALETSAWIPVGERLPDIGQSVLICTKDGQITDGYRWNSEDWFLAWGEFNGEHTGGEYAKIVAWMPLPERYKGGDDND